jgi:hypothetical protein
LLLWGGIGHSIAVQRIQAAYAEPLGNAHGDSNVVAKLHRPRWDREHAAVSAREIASEEVQPDELNARVAHGCNEPVDLRIRWHRLIGPGPPKLDGVETCRASRRGRSKSSTSVNSSVQLAAYGKR